MTARATVRCAGCGAAPRPDDPYHWACPERRPGDDIDHVMVRHVSTDGMSLVTSESDNPFVRYRGLLYAHHRWMQAGHDDASFVAMVDDLDKAVAAVDGHGFRRTPLTRFPRLDAAVGARVWVKDETANVAGSHKGRHLFGVMILLLVAERLGLVKGGREAAPLAVASCGNAALAAAVVAAAARRRLEVFVPKAADSAVVARLADLGAQVTVCDRVDGVAGDPCYHRFRQAVAAGSVPFSCQGPDNGLAIEGGATLAWETAEALASAGVVADRLVVQVGGGALASACIQGLQEAVALHGVATMPRIDAVQTEAVHPLARAWSAVTGGMAEGLDPDAAWLDAAHHRSRYMWAWDSPPASVAHGILDDETYDWVAVGRGLTATGGSVILASERRLLEANQLARLTTDIAVDPTGSAGLAGLLAAGPEPGRDVVVIFSGRQATAC